MKDTFYFSHDYSSRSDEKIKLLIRKHGMIGYGCFWSIVEDLYQNANALRLDYEGIAYDLRIDVSIAKSLLNDFDLFIIDGDTFGSLSVERRLNERNEKSKKAKESANYRWEQQRLKANALKADANALHSECESNAIKESKVKESKVKESKVKKKLSIEEKDAFIAKIQGEFYHSLTPYFGIYPKDEIDKFYNYWSESNTALTKIKWQMEPTWDLHRRLERWMKNNKEFNTKFTKPNNQQPNGQKKLSY